MKYQRTQRLLCSTLPEPKDWQDLMSKKGNENGDVIQIILADKDGTKLTIRRIFIAIAMPLKKDMKYHYEGFLGLIQSESTYDPEISYFFAEVNHTKKTCKLKVTPGRFTRQLPER